MTTLSRAFDPETHGERCHYKPVGGSFGLGFQDRQCAFVMPIKVVIKQVEVQQLTTLYSSQRISSCQSRLNHRDLGHYGEPRLEARWKEGKSAFNFYDF